MVSVWFALVGLGRVGLGWVGLGWVGLGWVGLLSSAASQCFSVFLNYLHTNFFSSLNLEMSKEMYGKFIVCTDI